ncbi:band 4.1-like protein 2 isoform X1 [Gadus macrocephalus]|uniref:band 4.1-like protein 2 isoform X1 n=1 Tax=Gadus macrocephalus TaxID=80720 RepID=UPI0028CBAC18|nr:band 4.1-like protein 2 isoform X1 [Gadus macrocephalus]
MTTEVGSETEVKEKAEETATQPDQPEKATEDNQEVANTENATAEGGEEEEVVVEEEEDKKEKDGKGISRFLPPWLKKQKSQGQVVANETSPTNKVISEATEEEEAPAPAPETNGHIEEVEEKEEVQSEEVKQKEAESTSNASADTQPATEEKVTESTAQSPGEAKSATEDVKEEEQQQKKNEVEGKSTEPAATGDGKGTADEGLSSIFQSPLRLVRRNKMKLVVCHVALLDGTDFPCEVEKRAKGQFLFFKVYEHLNLMERDYFGLTYKDSHEQRCWLDPTKDIKRQIRSNNWQFSFNVKFYPPDPSLLTEDITRYLLCLQLREDVASGRLPCSFVTHALLGSYTLQAEHGDYEPDQPQPLDYITQQSFAPNQNKEMEEKILELHKSHRGMNPAQADTQFLENAKKLSMYGVDLHRAKDSEGVDIMLGVCANGLLVYKDKLRINRFAWPKILKISYKRNNYYIKIRPGESEQFESTVGFKLPNHRSAKRLWKVCVENHSFFRLNSPEVPPKARFLTLGSKFRYSGRTQTQTRLASSLIDRPAPNFERTSSKRISRSLDGAPVINITEAGSENGHEPHLELHSDSKSPMRVHGQNIYVRHSNLMLEDHDKTQEDVLRHQASISQLKRSFMEAPPPSPPQPNQWEKRFSSSPAATLRAQHHPPEQPAASVPTEVSAADNNSFPDTKEPGKTAQVEIEETHVIQEVSKETKPATVTVTVSPSPDAPEGVALQPEVREQEVVVVVEEASDTATRARQESVSSESESDEEAEYQPNLPSPISHTLIPEEKEEEVEEVEREEQGEQEKGVEPDPITKETAPHPIEASQSAQDVEERENGAEEEKGETDDSTEDPMMTPDEVPNGHALPEEEAPGMAAMAEEEEAKVNGESPMADSEPRPQVICCSEPPVVKTEMVTISDTFAAQKTHITTKEVPIVHTETKTITYEAAQLDNNGEGDPGVLMTAQTITSESLCTTTTTHITKTLKGGLSETRIEKRIVITGDSDIDHDQALAQAIKEAKEQHPDMSVTRVVVHKETELAEEDE